MTIEIVDFPMKNGGSFHSYVTVYQRVESGILRQFSSHPGQLGRAPIHERMDVFLGPHSTGELPRCPNKVARCLLGCRCGTPLSFL